MEKIVKIYSLSDPVTGEIRYIGKTIQKLQKRLKRHLSDSEKNTTHKSNWIKSLTKKGLTPSIEIIDEVFESGWEFWEKYWISQFKSWGFRLTK